MAAYAPPAIMSTSDGAEPHPPASAENSRATSSTPNFSNLPLHTEMRIVAERAYKQYEARGDLDALEASIQCLRLAMGATEDDHPEKVAIINNLGVALNTRFKCVGERQDLEEVISLEQLANALTPHDSPDRPSRLSNLAASIFSRFQREGRAEDLEEAIRLWTHAVELIPDGHVHKPRLLNNLGSSHGTRFEQLGNLADLESAIALHARAVELTPDGHPHKPSRLNNSGNSHQTRFEQLGKLEDLESAIALHARAVDLTPAGHPEKPSRLSNSGNSHQIRFEQLGELEDLESAIALHARAVDLTPDGHPDKPSLFNSLGSSHQTRFRQLGKLEDLESAIALHARAVELTPNGHPDKPSRLSNSGNSHQIRFEQLGKLEDLESAISLHAHAVDLTPDGHPDKPSRLNNSGSSLKTRFERLGLIEDLESTIKLFTRAAELTPDDHPSKPGWLNNLASSLARRYERTRDLKDLETAIAHQSRAVDLTPDSHREKPSRLNNLGTKLQMKFEQLGSLDDLGHAIMHLTNAVSLAPEGHPNKPGWLHNLSNSLQVRFNEAGNVPDLEEAFRCSTCSVDLLPKNHAARAPMLRLLGGLFVTRLRSPFAQADDATRAIEVFLEAMQHPNSHPLERFQACRQYTVLLSEFPDLFTTPPRITLLDAYKYALGLIPQCIWMGNNVRGRYTSKELPVIGAVVNDGVTAAISAGEYGLALEWLETGRAVVWSQVLQLRTPLDDLRQLHPQLGDDLYHVSQVLQHAATSPYSSLPSSTESRKTQPSLEDQAQSSHTYALEYEKLITQIRELDGFEDFLLPKTLSQLTDACVSGPVVVINVHESRSDALILHGAGNVVHVPLPDLSLFRATDVQNELWDLLRAKRFLNRSRCEMPHRDEHGEDRGGRVTAMDPPDMMRKILADLWNWMVKPIVDVVCTLVPPSTTLPHITWCPTGPLAFLPLHAAGIYPKHESTNTHSQTIMDVAVSSYTPTLEALLKPRTKVTAGDTEYPKALVVSQPATPNCDPIPNTRTEAENIISLIGQSTHLDDTGGTVQAVLEGMAMHDWVHLACHGVQNRADPMNSAFALHDGRLTLSMLMSHHLPNADLAVLSACQTATGDEKLSEEAVHLAAGMLNAGYKSVIGTMWSISDYIAPEVMRVFYTVMAEQVEAGGELQPAYALHEAMKALRSKPGGMNDFMRWVPFVHFGL
ncbi:CHAT domain-containing protein [Irpex rosettiformis]|uniref:CHAT domain-containing protein n=1 Tax=Irpex rosettiformis TaxID=378272 RepID=A0ACB8TMT0_9APHY|nr:CHAT domain-containing protein [Irpex rosettiformis]